MIVKKMDISIEEISLQLGVSESSLLTFLEQSHNENTIHAENKIEEKPFLFILDEYEKHLHSLVLCGKRSAQTERGYKSFISRLRNFLIENYPSLNANELNEVILNEAITYNNNSNFKFSVRTLNSYNTIIRSILRFAIHKEYTKKDIRYKFTLERSSLIPRYIKQKDIKRVIEVTEKLHKPHRCRALIMFLLLTGCRVSEVSNMKIKNFDIENNLIYIKDGKGNKDRVIPMFDELKEEIISYLHQSGYPEWSPYCEGYLFARDEGIDRKRKIPVRTIQHLVERIRNRLPELHLTVHTFRHTFAVYCLKAGIDFHYLTDILGHSDPKTTMVYTKLDGEDLKAQIKEKFPFPLEDLLNTILEDQNEKRN